MFSISDLKHTRYYQEVAAEVILEYRKKMLAHFLDDRFEPSTGEEEIQQREHMMDTLPHLEGDHFSDVVFALARETPQRALQEILKGRFDQIPEAVELKIEQTHRKALEGWIWQALIVESIETFSDIFIGRSRGKP
jgi:predicted transposase YdaD